MATFKKNKNGTYTGVVYIGRDIDGKNLRKQITKNTLKECKIAARELEDEIESKSLNNLSIMKMSDYMDKWLEINKPFLSSTTIKAYKLYIEHHFKPYFWKMKVNQISEIHIKNYLAEKLETLSSTTVRKHFFTLSKMLKDALKDKSPCFNIKAPKTAEFEVKIPTEKEFNDIVNIFRKINPEDEAIILLAGWCGLRRGEIFALKWNDINEDTGLIKIDEAVALVEDGYSFGFKAPKSSNGIRSIIAPEHLISLLLSLKPLKCKDKKDKEDDLDIQHEIFTQNPHSFTKKYSRVLKENNLPKVRFHDLRHYHASLLYKNNVPDIYAAERLGHDIWVLKKIYQHLGLEEKAEMDQKIKDIFK